VKQRVVESGQLRGACSFYVEYYDLVVAVFEPHARHIESLLRTDVPEAPDGVTVDPHRAFAKGANVEKGVSCLGEIELSLIEAGTCARFVVEGQLAGFFHGQRKDRPAFHGFAAPEDLFCDSGAFATQNN